MDNNNYKSAEKEPSVPIDRETTLDITGNVVHLKVPYTFSNKDRISIRRIWNNTVRETVRKECTKRLDRCGTNQEMMRLLDTLRKGAWIHIEYGYCERTEERHIKDCDNHKTKEIIDDLVGILIPTDRGDKLYITTTTVTTAPTEQTNIWLMPQAEYADWLMWKYGIDAEKTN